MVALRGGGQVRRFGYLRLLIIEEDRVGVGEEVIRGWLITGVVAHLASSDDGRGPNGRVDGFLVSSAPRVHS